MPNKTPNPFESLVDDVLPIVPFVGQWVLNFVVDLGVAIVHPYRLLVRNQLNESKFVLLARFLITIIRYPLQLILTVGSLLLNACASLINNAFRLSHERKLSSDELNYLRPIFGDSVQYDSIRLQFGGVKEMLHISPQAVGDDIFIRKIWGVPMTHPDGSLSKAGLRLLGHEVAHVWQYQNMGAGYIGDSLLTQILDALGRKVDLPFSEGYDLLFALKEKRRINDYNVEQQAVMAEMIGLALCEDNCAVLDRHTFNKVSGYSLNEEEFSCAMDAHAWFAQANGAYNNSDIGKA